MITENGIVTSANASTAWVKTIRSSACESCASRDTCGTAENHKEMIIQVSNTLMVEEGDRVLVGLETRPIMVLTFFLYVFPVILMIIGALAGENMGPYLGMNPSFASVISGFLFFAIAFVIIRIKHNSLSRKKEYKPFLIRKISSVIPKACSIS
jgi:sigma-E factor negative regulatory protein RseC